MIVATAGHVDHGKTLLVKALTGVDADRLPEEKQRGMTIDLGFAYLPVEGAATIGFIDVPGHERFIRNMLCGVAGIDVVLFVVAADDGPKPQTAEHLAILDLLGISRGAVAITKIDRIAPERVAEVEAEVKALLAGTTLERAPMFRVCAPSGEGIAVLRDHLERMARGWAPRPTNGNFRLAVDRRFTLPGAGLIVTGTVHAGEISVGDRARTLGAGLPVRVRSIHAQNAKSDRGRAGERCALNLTGADIGVDAIERGEWVVAGEAPTPAAKIDVRLTVLADEARPLAHWTPVHVHLGAADATGRVALLEGKTLEPGASGLAQLVLERPIGAVRGDRLILRDQSASRTVGGGRVIDIFPPPRGRARPARLAALAAQEIDDDGAALAALLDGATRGLDLERFAANRNLTSAEADALFARVAMRPVTTATGRVGFSPEHWEALKAAAVEALDAWHRRSPGAVGLTEDRVLAQTTHRLPREVSSALVDELMRAGTVAREGAGVRLASHRPSLASADAALWRKLEPVFEGSGMRPPSMHEIAATVGEDPKKLESFLVRAARFGLLVRVAQNRFYRPADIARLAEVAEEIADGNSARTVAAAAFRDRSGIGRNLAIEVLEYFDRVKFTHRVGDQHRVMRPAREAFGGARPEPGVGSRPLGKESHPGGAPGLQTR